MDGDILITIIAIGTTVVLLFVFPMMTLADRNDDITELAVQTLTTDFIDQIRRTGKLTLDQYNSFITALAATGNAYDVQLEFQILDENPGKKDTQGNSLVIGENVYYSIYTIQIEARLDSGTYYLKEGDIVSATVKNTSTTLAQTLRNVYYRVTGNDTYTIYASWAGTVTVNGK